MQEFMTFAHQHWLLSLTFILVVVGLLIIEFFKQRQGTTALSPNQVTQLMNHNDAVVIDVRSNILFNDGHIIGAQSVPLTEFNEKTKKLDKFKTKPVVVVCQLGNESPRAADTLREQGFNVFTLAGGLRSWLDANMPLVKG